MTRGIIGVALTIVALGVTITLYNPSIQANDGSGKSKPAGKTDTPVSQATNFASTNTLTTQTNAEEPEVKIIAKAPPQISALNLRPELEEIVKMSQSGIGEEVIEQYIKQSPYAYTNLTAQEIITLNDLGVSQNIIAAMLRKAGRPEIEKDAAIQKEMTISITNETITTTTGQQQSQSQTPVAQQATQPQAQQPLETTVAQTQVYTQTVYVPVQEQPQAQVVQQTQPPVVVNYFYNSLAPYGSWLVVDGYGYCWQPTVAIINPYWRPYYHGGRWVWTDYGWYWLSDYSWGWATFHYGRWHYLRHHGWVWFPDTIWGPAWVSWRITPDYAGWAPLPLHAHYVAGVGFTYYGRNVSVHFDFGLSPWHYTFIEWRHFHHRNPYHYYLPPEHRDRIYNNSTVINNYIVGNNNNVVINTGVGTDNIVKATREEVRKVVVRDAPTIGSTPIPAERLVKDGNNIVLYKPSLPAQSAVSKANFELPKPVPVAQTSSTGAPIKNVQPAKSGIQPIEPKPQPIKSAEPITAKPISGKTISDARQTVQPPVSAPVQPIKPIQNQSIKAPDTKSSLPVQVAPTRKVELPSTKPAPSVVDNRSVIASKIPTRPENPPKIETKPEIPKVDIPKVEPQKTTPPIITHTWSQTGKSEGIVPKSVQTPTSAQPQPVQKPSISPVQSYKPIPTTIVKPQTPITQSPAPTPQTGNRLIAPATPSMPRTPTVQTPSVEPERRYRLPVRPEPVQPTPAPISPSTPSRSIQVAPAPRAPSQNLQPITPYTDKKFTPLPTPSYRPEAKAVPAPHTYSAPVTPVRPTPVAPSIQRSEPPKSQYSAPTRSITPSSSVPVTPRAPSYSPAPSAPSSAPAMPSPSSSKGGFGESKRF